VARPDLNLLVALDVLLAEKSVVRAARRLQLSPSAMSRTLARLRASTGDPLLVRAGRALVATPRADEMREHVAGLVQQAEAALRPAAGEDPGRAARTFTLRTGEGFVENFGPALLRRVSKEAPQMRLVFVPKLDRDSSALREGRVDLETGVVGKTTGPEVRAQTLFRDRFVGVVRARHPLAKGRVTAARYASSRHVETTQHVPASPADVALSSLGLVREIAVVVSGFAAALALARQADFVATVPDRHTGNLRAGMHVFALPFATPSITVSLLWHPRLDADPAHRWLRRCIREICG
jgi:DNA-binding transcriptional LysR family regulator